MFVIICWVECALILIISLSRWHRRAAGHLRGHDCLGVIHRSPLSSSVKFTTPIPLSGIPRRWRWHISGSLLIYSATLLKSSVFYSFKAYQCNTCGQYLFSFRIDAKSFFYVMHKFCIAKISTVGLGKSSGGRHNQKAATFLIRSFASVVIEMISKRPIRLCMLITFSPEKCFPPACNPKYAARIPGRGHEYVVLRMDSVSIRPKLIYRISITLG